MGKFIKSILFLLCAVNAQAAYTLMTTANNTFTTAATWALCDATSESDSEAANTVLTTARVVSSPFAPGAITVDGVAVKVASRAAVASGTMTVILTNITDGVDVDLVTVNVSDLDQTGGTGVYNHGWKFFKFGSSHLLVAGKNYGVAAATSAASQVNLYSTATSNWTRELRTTTTQAPAAGDKLLINGEMTGAGAITTRTVTLDNTAATVFGSTSYPASIVISKGGTLAMATTASTAFQLVFAGILYGAESGTLDTSALDATSTVTFQNSNSVNVDGGFYFGNGFTSKLVGSYRGRAWTKLTADVSPTGTGLTTADITGWSPTDSIILASTSATYSQDDLATINTIAGTSITTGAGVTYGHSGTSPTQCEVGNLTRNVIVEGTSGTFQSYIYASASSVNYWTNTCFRYLGSATVGKRGIDVACTGATFSMVQCALRDFSISGSRGIVTAPNAFSTIVSNVFYNIYSGGVYVDLTSDGAVVIGSNFFVHFPGASTTGSTLYVVDNATVITNNAITGTANYGVQIACTSVESSSASVFSDNVIHSSFGRGLRLSGVGYLYAPRQTIWRNDHAVEMLAGCVSVTLADSNFFQNPNGVVDFSDNSVLTNCTFNSGSTAANLGVIKYAGTPMDIRNCSFGATTPLAFRDISAGGKILGNWGSGAVRAWNCTFASSNMVYTTGCGTDAFIFSARHNGTAGDNRFWSLYGNGLIDSVASHVRTGSSLKLIPNDAVNKLKVPYYFSYMVAVPSGASRSVSIWVRKSDATGGDVAYNGNQPRLILLQDVALGLATDTVLATAAAANGTWEKLTGTVTGTTADGVCRLWVDCDGTAGFINVDDFSAQSDTTQRFNYWSGFPSVWGASGGSISSVSVQ